MTIPPDTLNVPQPEPLSIHTYAEYFEKQVMLQVAEGLDIPRQYRNLTNSRGEAKNVDTFGEVPNSSWFTNRIGSREMTIEEMRRGPNSGQGPDTTGAWTVIRAKAEGVTPGFTIRDQQGGTYVIKFDPVGYPELASGAEVISTKLFYAMGYNTPENYLVFFHPDNLKLAKEVKFTDEKGRKRFMNELDLKEILANIQSLPDGRIRALASKYLEGVPIGPFKYKGFRKDDFNDFIKHEDRRELRGLRIFAAWLNHFDTKDGNTLDMYVTEDGRSYVKHYLIDFGATLGSGSNKPNFRWRGFQYDFDPAVLVSNIFSLGLYVRPWEKKPDVIYPSVGVFYSDLFDPIKYKPQVPNPAFESMTLLDGYWAAKIVMSFSDEYLREVVAEARYLNPEAAAYILETLAERRDKIGEYFFSELNPLDNFMIHDDEDGKPVISFDNLAIRYGFSGADGLLYQYTILSADGEKGLTDPVNSTESKIPLSDLQSLLTANERGTMDSAQSFIVELRTLAAEKENWRKPIHLWLEGDVTEMKFTLLGVERKR